MMTVGTAAIKARQLAPGDVIVAKETGMRFQVKRAFPSSQYRDAMEVQTDQGTYHLPHARTVIIEAPEEGDPFAGVETAPAEPVRRVDEATDKQKAFIVKLRKERDEAGPKVDDLSKREASEEIERLLAIRPKTDDLPDVPEGRYALDKVDGSGVVFYQVDRPAEGRWAGYTFVKLLLGAPGDWRRERVGDWREVIKRIADAGPRKAAIRFGMESGHCGRCGSPLSNEESRRLGIGPVCRDKAGWLVGSPSREGWATVRRAS